MQAILFSRATRFNEIDSLDLLLKEYVLQQKQCNRTEIEVDLKQVFVRTRSNYFKNRQLSLVAVLDLIKVHSLLVFRFLMELFSFKFKDVQIKFVCH